MGRLQGRITKEDIKGAGFRRWDGQRRITTDWINIFFVRHLDQYPFVANARRNRSCTGPMATLSSICESPVNRAEGRPLKSTPSDFVPRASPRLCADAFHKPNYT